MKFSENNKNRIKKIYITAYGWAVIIFYAFVVGATGGLVGSAFAKSLSFATQLRAEHGWLIYLLPFGGLISVLIYKLTKTEGIVTDRALEASAGSARMPARITPVIFAATTITHLLGGSAGKEGAALQAGSGVAELISKLTKADEKKRAILTICGMAAVFSAMLGTPVAACVFALEVAVIGKLNSRAIFPALTSSITAHFISLALGVVPERFHIGTVPDMDIMVILKTAVIAVAVSVVAGVFCLMINGGHKFAGKVVKNPFVRIFAGGCIIVVLTLIFGTDYNGGGIFVIERIFEEATVKPEAFLLKIIFTVITISAGFKGGEIVPSFFIGSTLGAALAGVMGLPIGLSAAIGMIAFFSAATNCQIASAVIAVEFFGTEGFVYFAVAAFASRIFFRNTSLYQKQKYI